VPTFERLARFDREYGEEIAAGEPHVVWRRVGTHGVLAEP
jgi:hypothetical protein